MRLISVFLVLCLMGCLPLAGQGQSLAGKRIGLYISSKAVTYGQDYYLPIAQFVTREDDAAWSGKLKSEFLITMGWLLSEQLQPLAQADTVYFLNADLALGRAMQEAIQEESGRFVPGEALRESLDMVVILDEFALNIRNHRSVYIRSNRMITENIPIKTLRGSLSVIDLSAPGQPASTSFCLDDQTTPAPAAHFDFHAATSPMGRFLSKGFSLWWQLLAAGEAGNCGE